MPPTGPRPVGAAPASAGGHPTIVPAVPQTVPNVNGAPAARAPPSWVEPAATLPAHGAVPAHSASVPWVAWIVAWIVAWMVAWIVPWIVAIDAIEAWIVAGPPIVAITLAELATGWAPLSCVECAAAAKVPMVAIVATVPQGATVPIVARPPSGRGRGCGLCAFGLRSVCLVNHGRAPSAEQCPVPDGLRPAPGSIRCAGRGRRAIKAESRL